MDFLSAATTSGALALFGSVLRDDFGPDSDIDVLVEFEVGHVPGLAFLRLEQDLSKLLGGRRIDLVTPSFLNARIRDRVLGDAEVQYVQGCYFRDCDDNLVELTVYDQPA